MDDSKLIKQLNQNKEENKEKSNIIFHDIVVETIDGQDLNFIRPVSYSVSLYLSLHLNLDHRNHAA